ncbi:Diacylglycerol kinase gamma [Strongyloides ratti]|uniref:Diacylglycerol kinase n=1 Tax=Strongyloides ratti TaxID=34506 RepID=A0A090L6Y2_STRRB|nr:Diacylglycerol kinase gamma [Strongyloides ratti]CEF65502.1 Diacylglycerol kinase gamma [Strongyloides ratti]
MKRRTSSKKTSNIQGKTISNDTSINENDTGIYTFSDLISIPNDSVTKECIVNGQFKDNDTTSIELNKRSKESSINDKQKKHQISKIVLSNDYITNTRENISLIKNSNNDPTTSSQISSSKEIFKKINSIQSIENNNHNSNVDLMKDITTKYVKYICNDSQYKKDRNNNSNILRMKKIINEHLKTCNISKNNIYPILKNVDLISKFSYEEKLLFIFSYFDCSNDGIISKVDINLFLNQLIAYIEGENKLNDSIQNILLTLNKEMVYDKNGSIIIQDAINIIKNNDVIKALLEENQQSINGTNHHWSFTSISTKLYCGVCRNRTSVLSKKKGFICKFCSFFCHQSCLNEAPNNCITDYVTIKEDITIHHWLEIAQKQKCNNCFLMVKPFQGKRCRWCHETFHQNCIKNSKKCTYGYYKNFILPRDWCEKNINTGKVDIIAKDINRKPVLVLINPKSGGNEGNEIFKQFLQLLHPRQVYSLDEITPQEAINNFRFIKNFRILVGGGDGTITWVQETLDKCNFENDLRPPMMILPIGTGNDLSRSLKWGGGVIKVKPLKLLRKMEKSKIVYLDRWRLNIYNIIKNDENEFEKKPPATIFNNYFSIGIDAQICHKFHKKRQTNPELFSNRTKNKLHYIELGAVEMFSNSWNEFSHEIDVNCDDDPLNIKGIGIEGICVLNTPFIHGGTNMSHSNKKSICVRVGNFFKKHFHNIKTDQMFTPKCIDDGLIEIIGFKNMFHLITLRSGVKEPLSLAQVKKIHITTRKTFPMQVDGEPWLQEPCDIIISHHNKVPMFMKA